MIRKATIADIPAITRLAIEAVSRQPLEGLRISRDRIGAVAEAVITRADCFCWVAVDADGEVQGCVAAECMPGFWFERHQCNVLMFYCRLPGQGARLLREFARWVKSRPTIKLAVFSVEPDENAERIGKLLARLGFGLRTTSYAFVRGPKSQEVRTSCARRTKCPG